MSHVVTRAKCEHAQLIFLYSNLDSFTAISPSTKKKEEKAIQIIVMCFYTMGFIKRASLLFFLPNHRNAIGYKEIIIHNYKAYCTVKPF